MLTMMRQLLRSKLAGLLFVILIVAMAAWGVTDVFSSRLGSNLVAAGSRVISDQQFDEKVERILRNETDDRGRSITKEEALDAGLIDRIFQQEQIDLALRAYGDRVGVTATGKAVQAVIKDNPVFHDTTGVFDPAQYQGILSNSGIRPADYQDNLEATLTINRLQLLPTAGLKVPGALARIEAGFLAEMRSAQWFILPASSLPQIPEPTDEDLQALFAERGEALREPERRQVSLIRLSPDDFRSRAEITDLDIEAFYGAYKAERYTGPDTRSFTEFHFSDEATARAALGRIAGGAAASELTGLIDTRERSGQRNSISNPRLADLVFSQTAMAGGVYGPLLNNDQWTVIRLETVTPGDATPLDIVREAIGEELADEQATGLFYEALTRFDTIIGSGASLEDIAADLGAPVLTFAPVAPSGVTQAGQRFQPLIEAPGLLDAVFSRPEGGLTERFSDGEVTWLARVDRIVPSRAPGFDEVRSTLALAWTADQASRAMATRVGDIEARIRAGDSTLAAEAAALGAQVEAPPRPLTRTNYEANLPPQLLSGLFDARSVGDILSAPGLPGDMIILEVTLIDRPAPETLDLLATTTAASIQPQLANDLYLAFFNELQGETDLEVNAKALDAYKRSIVPQQ